VTAVAEERSAAVTAFDGLRTSRGPGVGSWLEGRQREAFERFGSRGLPTTRDEEWRQTSVAPIARTSWTRPPHAGRLTASLIASVTGVTSGVTAVFVDGRYSAEMSSISDATGVAVTNLAGPRGLDGEALQSHLGRVPGSGATPFGDLNMALFEDGALVAVPADAAIAEPIHLVFLSSAGDGRPFASHPRVLVLAGKGSEATVVETHAGLDGVLSLTNAVTEIVVGDGARLDHYRMQREGNAAFHVGVLAVRLGRDSRFRSVTVSLGALLSRLDLMVRFDAPGGDATLDGLFMADGSRHVDVHSRVEHNVPHCSSRQLYKGILDDTSRGVFNGLVVVEKGAQKTDAAQANRNILLSRGALVHSTPQLLILADDVKCKHGSTTGQLDPVALFYLRSRGIGEAAARSLLTYAFASDILSRISVEPLRVAVEKYLAERLQDASIIREVFA